MKSDQPCRSAVAILKRMYVLEFIMEVSSKIKDILKRIFLVADELIIFFEQCIQPFFYFLHFCYFVVWVSFYVDSMLSDLARHCWPMLHCYAMIIEYRLRCKRLLFLSVSIHLMDGTKAAYNGVYTQLSWH